MTDYKKQAAIEAGKIIKQSQTIGLGAGTTIMHLLELLVQQEELVQTLTFTSSSNVIWDKLIAFNVRTKPTAELLEVDIYFDGCDQVDMQLHALKSGGGIHTAEKIIAAMAKQFIILGDAGKLTTNLDATYPLTIEVIPAALTSVRSKLIEAFDIAAITQREALTTANNYLLDMKFNILPDLQTLNNIKMMPGVVDHSLFYGLATGAIICGEEGTKYVGQV